MKRQKTPNSQYNVEGAKQSKTKQNKNKNKKQTKNKQAGSNAA